MYPQDYSCAKFGAKIFVWVRHTAVNVMYYSMWESWSFHVRTPRFREGLLEEKINLRYGNVKFCLNSVSAVFACSIWSSLTYLRIMRQMLLHLHHLCQLHWLLTLQLHIECLDLGHQLWHCWSPCPVLSQSWGLKIVSSSRLPQESKLWCNGI